MVGLSEVVGGDVDVDGNNVETSVGEIDVGDSDDGGAEEG